MCNDVEENLRTAYRELCTSYRAIDDFRAKLLGFLPLATGTGIFLLLERGKDVIGEDGVPPGLLMAIGIFGLVVTLGLFVYELYGIKKCSALIETGKQMEASMGIPGGQFGSRPKRRPDERFAAWIIYPAVLAAWAFFALYSAAQTAKVIIPVSSFSLGLLGR